MFTRKEEYDLEDYRMDDEVSIIRGSTDHSIGVQYMRVWQLLARLPALCAENSAEITFEVTRPRHGTKTLDNGRTVPNRSRVMRRTHTMGEIRALAAKSKAQSAA